VQKSCKEYILVSLGFPKIKTTMARGKQVKIIIKLETAKGFKCILLNI
jgi:hypothetical protein